MKKERLLWSIFWILPSLLTAQFISQEAALEDLRYLAEAVEKGHPTNYQSEQQVDLSDLISEVSLLTEDSLRSIDFRFLVGKALQAIGCVHTSVRKDPLAYRPDSAQFFPFQLELTKDGKLLVAAPLDSPYLGREIVGVNGEEASELSKKMSQYLAADGGSAAYSRAAGGYLASRLLARYFGFPEAYDIKFKLNAVRVKAVDKEVKRGSDPFPFEPNEKGAQFTFGIKDSIGLLRMNKFVKNDRKRFKQLFKQIDEEQSCKALILDLRGNGGGDRKTAVALVQELINERFSYSILRPKLKSMKYLTGKGKRFLLLGKLKYDIGGFYRGKKTAYGRAYRFGTPAGKRAFTGDLIVLTDGFTASASTMVTTWLKKHREVTFVGEQAAGGYNGNNGGIFPLIRLPNSEMEIRFPAYRLVMDEKSEQRVGIVPDHVVVPTSESIRGRRDLVLEYALGLIR